VEKMENIRTFISIDLQDKEIIRNIINIQRSFREDNFKIKYVEEDNLHFTLKFFGEVEKEKLQIIENNLSSISVPELSLKGIGCFTPSFPRVLWAGVEKGGDELRRLSKNIEDKMNTLGFPSEKKGFSAHLTIGRIKYLKDKKYFLEKIDTFRELILGEYTINNFRLKKSTLSPEGPIYETLREYKLEGS
jgi:2'-5' RNA ligase